MTDMAFRWKGIVAVSAISLVLAGCGQTSQGGSNSSGNSTSGNPSKPYAGQTIIVANASQAPTASVLKQFEQQTGIKVQWENVGWDSLQTKIVAAAEAHTYYADVTDVDWSRVGLYEKTGWFTPLNKYFNTSQLKSDVPELNSFVVDGKLIGMPVDGSIMLTTINKSDFQKAGIKQLPTTLASYQTDLKLIQNKGINQHPLGIPFAATEELSTYWYELTGAFGGSLVGPNNAPLFTSPTSPGYKALEWMVNAYKSGLVPPANINMTAEQEMQGEMPEHRISSIFSDYSGNVGAIYDVKGQSKVIGQIEYIPTPGVNGIGPNLGNPDGMGIPSTAKHVGAAVEFLKWITSPKIQAVLSGLDGSNAGNIVGYPMRLSSMQMLANANQVSQGKELISLFTKAKPVFPDGAPTNYPQFSQAAYTNIHAAAQGQESVSQAIQKIAASLKQSQ